MNKAIHIHMLSKIGKEPRLARFFPSIPLINSLNPHLFRVGFYFVISQLFRLKGLFRRSLMTPTTPLAIPYHLIGLKRFNIHTTTIVCPIGLMVFPGRTRVYILGSRGINDTRQVSKFTMRGSARC